MDSASDFVEIASLLFWPVKIAIYALFVWSLFELGRALVQAVQRYRNNEKFIAFAKGDDNSVELRGYPIAAVAIRLPHVTVEELDLASMRKLEAVRVVTRITPMLGLIATLIPMGPALVALTKNDIAQMSDLLRTAFAAVVLALFVSSLCFLLATVRRRWCVEEVLAAKRRLEAVS